jgi:UrcA family protein
MGEERFVAPMHQKLNLHCSMNKDQETPMKTSFTFRRLTAAAVVAFAAGFTVIAHADQSTDAPQVIVKYADLSVSSPQGAVALYHRIRAAAVTVCQPLDESNLASKQTANACIHKALADAVAEVDQPALSAVYREKNRLPVSPVLTAGNR